jgi:hypothetical protein
LPESAGVLKALPLVVSTWAITAQGDHGIERSTHPTLPHQADPSSRRGWKVGLEVAGNQR